MNCRERLIDAVLIARHNNGVERADQKQWVIDQMVRALLHDRYEQWVIDTEAGNDGPYTFHWDVGVDPRNPLGAP